MNIKDKTQLFLGQILFPLLRIPYFSKWIILLIDITLSMIAFTLSYLICYQLQSVPVLTDAFLFKLVLHMSVTVFFFLLFRTYNGIIRYSTFMDALNIFIAVFSTTVVMIIINYAFSILDKSIFLNIGFCIYFALAFSFMFIVRMFVKITYDNVKDIMAAIPSESGSSDVKSLLIIGVSSATVSLARIIKTSNSRYKLIGFVSLDYNAGNKTIIGIPVIDNEGRYKKMLEDGSVQAVLFDPNQFDRKIKQEIADLCLSNKIQMLSPPPVSDWCKKKEMSSIQIEDLLGRTPIEIDTEGIHCNLSGKCILITGAAGSIGSEIVRQICRFNPSMLLLCDIGESPLHHLQLEIGNDFPNVPFKTFISDVKDFLCMNKIFTTYKPDYVYHAAAYKHVPLMEEHPSTAVLTNVLGTKNIADLSVEHNVKAFVMISTDKAVNPTNIMGTSKRIAEIYIQSLSNKLKNRNSEKTRFITTRFGNVLGSNGSVIPLFKEQLVKGGPLTVTHPDIIRYFMTIPEACRLVLEAGNMGKGGEIFVFDMGKPVKIVDMAERMIQLAGYVPYQDIDIRFIGLRPGEKLYEELLTHDEYSKPTYNKKIMISTARLYLFDNIKSTINFLIDAASSYNEKEVVSIMKNLVPEYEPAKILQGPLLEKEEVSSNVS